MSSSPTRHLTADEVEDEIARNPASDSELEKNARAKSYEYQDAGMLPQKIKIAYSLPQLGTTSASFLISVYGTRFFSLLGAQLSFIAFFTALARSFDVLTDPFMGWFSDSTRSKHGRRRPYMLGAAPFYALLFILLFLPPYTDGEAGSGQAVSYWFGFFYVIFFLFDTIGNVPYQALGPELTDNYEERNSLFMLAKVCNFMGVLFAAGGPAFIKWYLRRGKDVEDIDCQKYFSHTEAVETSAGYLPKVILASTSVLGKEFCTAEKGPWPKCFKNCETTNGDYCFQIGQQKGAVGEAKYYETSVDLIIDRCFNFTGASSAYFNDKGVHTGNYSLPDAPINTTVPFDVFNVSEESGMRSSFMIVTMILGISYAASMVWAVFSINERQASSDTGAVPLVPSILRSLKNIAFQPLLIGWTLDAIALSALVAMFPFFVEYIVKPNGVIAQKGGLPGMSVSKCLGGCIFALLGAAVLSMPLWKMAAEKFGKRKTWLAYNVVNAATNILFIIPSEGDPFYTIAISFLNGIPVGGQFLIDSILADTIDYDEFLNGTRSEGGFSVFATFIPKFVSIPASALPIAIINSLGFIPPLSGVAQNQPTIVKNFIRTVFVFVPFCCCVLSFIVKLKFPIKNKEMSTKISEGINKHSQGDPALDPLTGREIKLLALEKEEEDKMWIFENFSGSQLRGLVEDMDAGKALRLVRSMLLQFLAAVGIFVTFAAIVGGTYGFMDNQALSIIPIISVIFAGFGLTASGFCVLRLRAAKTLSTLKKQDFKELRRLVVLLLKHKEEGQRAGDFVPLKERRDSLGSDLGGGDVGDDKL